jgi:hypothetical protein
MQLASRKYGGTTKRRKVIVYYSILFYVHNTISAFESALILLQHDHKAEHGRHEEVFRDSSIVARKFCRRFNFYCARRAVNLKCCCRIGRVPGRVPVLCERVGSLDLMLAFDGLMSC